MIRHKALNIVDAITFNISISLIFLFIQGPTMHENQACKYGVAC